MADIRINALATTTTGAASDDFAVFDGTTNGTRKIAATSFAFNDRAQTFTGTQTFGAVVGTTWNGNTWATGTGTLSIAAAKTLTASNSITLAGTDTTTMTFPTTSATIARTDAAQTFTGIQTIAGTSTVKFGATSAATIGVSADTTAGNLVLSAPSSGLIQAKEVGSTNYSLIVGGASGATTNILKLGRSGATGHGYIELDQAGGEYNLYVKTGDGSIALGKNAALATNATYGFVYIRGGAGTPTGAPTAITGLNALYVDQTNNKLYFYSGGAWRDAGP